MNLTFVPVVTINHPDTSVLEWTRRVTAKHPDLDLARKTLAISDFSVQVREPYYTNTDHRGGVEGMINIIPEILALHAADGATGYYYGVITQAAGGVGYVGFPVSVGLPHDGVIAHELGHNMNLMHAPPCGGADPDHPYDKGINIWGFDVEDTLLIPPTHYDIMCGGRGGWISDYHFSKMIAHRTSSGPDANQGGLLHEPLSLIVSGSVGPDSMTLDPLIVVRAPARLPKASGAASVVAYDRRQRELFSLRFTPREDKFGGRAFAFAVPANPDWEVDRIVLSGPDGSFTMDRNDPRTMTTLTDRETGRVRGLLRNWGNARVPTSLTSEGLNMRTTRAIPLSALGVVAGRAPRW